MDLEELIDGMDLSDNWGNAHLDLDGETDVEWAKKQKENATALGAHPMSTGLSIVPRQTRVIWQQSVRGKGARMGWKKPTEIYATRWRRHGSADPTSVKRNLL